MDYVEENPKGFRFFKFLRLGLRCGVQLLWAYFTWMIRYSNHPERYPLQKRYAKVRKIVSRICRALHIEFRVDGIERFAASERPFLLVANHLSTDDVVNLIALSPKPISFIAKKEAEKMIFVGRVIKCIDGFFLDRGDPFQAARIFKEASKRVASGLNYVIFPEGTRNRFPFTGPIKDFHAGSLKIAYWGKADLLPMAQFGTFRTLNSHYDDRSYLVQLKFFEPLPYSVYSAKMSSELAPELRELVAEGVEEMKRVDLEYKAEGRNKKKASPWWKDPEINRP